MCSGFKRLPDIGSTRYELGQSFMDQEDKRMRGVIDTLGR